MEDSALQLQYVIHGEKHWVNLEGVLAMFLYIKMGDSRDSFTGRIGRRGGDSVCI